MDIRELRKAKGWTQAELARKLGTDNVTVSRWERGVSSPRPMARRQLKELLGAPRTPKGRVPFAEDPTERLRELDRMLRQQTELNRRMRVASWTG